MHPEKIHIDDTYTYHDPYMHDGDGIDESYLSEISHSISSNPVDPIPLPEGAANSSLEEDAQQKNEEATLQNKNLKVLNETITISGVTDVPLFDNKDNVSVNTQVQDMNIQEKIPLNITGEKNLTQANNEYPPGNNTAFNSAIKPANTTFKTKTYFAQRRSEYSNKADFKANERLFRYIKSLALDGKESIVFVGGTNDGQLSKTILSWCPITFYGFEIQDKHFLNAKNRLAGFENVHMINMGWSEHAQQNISIGGTGETAGLYDPKGQRGWKVQTEKTVDTIPVSDFALQKNITRVLYIVIDTEGHEPKVIRGMNLNVTENQKRFSLFQFELGGTWAAADNRHGNDPWTQKTTIQALEEWGYSTFMVGLNDWLAVDKDFFEEEGNPAMENGGFGKFIQGNVLAVHRNFIPHGLKELIMSQVRYVR